MAEYVVEEPSDRSASWRVHEQIVRCKDCQHSYEHHDVRGRWLLCDLQIYDEVRPEDFCSRGEKRKVD